MRMKNIKTRWNRGKYEIPFKKISIYLDTGGKVFFGLEQSSKTDRQVDKY